MGNEFWSALQLIATFTVSGCFLFSGIAKLPRPHETAATFGALEVPSLLRAPFITRVYPWAELAIGLAVLLAPAPLWWPASLAATLMLAALVLLVARVLARRTEVSCNCFGSLQRVTWRTLTRNLVFLAFAVLLLVSPLGASSPVFDAARDETVLFVALLLGMGAAMLLTVLSQMGPPPAESRQSGHDDERVATRVPSLTLLDSAGEEHFLPVTVQSAPTLLVYVKPGCPPCERTIEFFDGRELIVDRVVVRLVERTPATGPVSSRDRLWDYEGKLADTLGLKTPSAVLIAPDGTVPAVPAYGFDEIETLVEVIAEAVSFEAG